MKPSLLKKTTLILNPYSGKGTPATLDQLHSLAAERSIQVITIDDSIELDAIIRQLIKRGLQRLIVAGGDGTVRSVAQLLIDTPVELAIIPLGTGNLLALNANISLSITAAFDLALTGSARAISCGLANQNVFLVAAGIGLDAKVMAEVTTEHKSRFGVLAYIVAVFKYLTDHSLKFSLKADKLQAQRGKAKLIMAANLGRIQAGIAVAPQATIDRQDLQLVIVECQTMSDWISLLAWLLRGQPRRSRAYRSYSIVQATITVEEPQPFQCDGDNMGKTDTLEIQLKPAALRLVYGE